MDQRARSLRAVVTIVGDLNLSHAVGFHSRLLDFCAQRACNHARSLLTLFSAGYRHPVRSALHPALLARAVSPRHFASPIASILRNRPLRSPLFPLSRGNLSASIAASQAIAAPGQLYAACPIVQAGFRKPSRYDVLRVTRIRLRLRTAWMRGASPETAGPRTGGSRRRPESSLYTVCKHQGPSHGISIPAWI